MRGDNKTVLLCVAALLLGLVISIPLFQLNLYTAPKPTFERPFITFDVPYAYFSINAPSQQVTGLSNKDNLVTYLFVVNITNYSNTTVYIDHINVKAASPYINTTNTPSTFSQTISGTFISKQLAFIRYSSPYDGLDYLSPYESELVAISGITKVSNTTALQSGVFFIGGNIEGSVGDWRSGWGGSQEIQVQNFGDEYLYNNLISSNQTLHIEGNAVYIRQES